MRARVLFTQDTNSAAIISPSTTHRHNLHMYTLHVYPSFAKKS